LARIPDGVPESTSFPVFSKVLFGTRRRPRI